MAILNPLMLLGLAGLTVPIVIHLIARHRFPVQNFPSLRLLRVEKRTNVFAWLLVDPWQLLLRLLVLALLVFAMCRFFTSWPQTAPAPQNMVIILDASASMRCRTQEGGETSLFDLARDNAKALLENAPPLSRTAVVVVGDRLQPLTFLGEESAKAIAALASVRPGESSGPGLICGLAEACRILRGRREVRSQIVVLSDMRASAFARRQQEDLRLIAEVSREQGAAWDMAFVDLAPPAANVAIIDAHLRGGEARVGDDARILVRVRNESAEESKTEIRLAIAGRDAGESRQIVLPSAAEAVVEMTAPINRPMQTVAEVRLHGHDHMPWDDRRLLPLRVAEICRVLVVRGSAKTEAALVKLGDFAAHPPADSPTPAPELDGPSILRFALNPGRELGASYSTGIETATAAVENLASQPLSKYDVVVLYDVDTLPEKAVDDLDAFVRGGKGLLIIPGSSAAPMRFNRSFATAVPNRQPLAPAYLGNDRDLAAPAGIAAEATGHPLLRFFRDRSQGDLSVIRFAKLREWLHLEGGAEIAARADNSMPLIITSRRELGRVMLLAFSLELERGNIARTRVFPPLLWRMIAYLGDRDRPRQPDILTATTPAVLDVSEKEFALETALSLARIALADGEAGATSTLEIPIANERTLFVDGLPAGGYLLQKPRRGSAAVVSGRPLAVVPDSAESMMAKIDVAALRDLLGVPLRVAADVRLTSCLLYTSPSPRDS